MAKKIITLLAISICFFSSSAFCANVSTLLEEGIYAEETKGDLDEAIMIYRKIIDENGGKGGSIAEAYYRLGSCYLKTGNDGKAIEMFKELLANFREHEKIASDARVQLLKLNALDEENQINKAPELGPVPWEAGEMSQYIIKTSAGAGSGKLFHSIKEITLNGNDLWRIETTVSTPITGIQTYLQTDVLKKNLRPLSSTMTGSAATIKYNYKAIYEKKHILFTNIAKEEKDIPVEGIVYDIGQQGKIIRRLPLAENYSVSFNVFNLQKGKIINVQLAVTGKETVTVPAGTFECYVLKQSTDSMDSIANTKMWVSDDAKKYIVKYEAQGTTEELEKVTRVTVEKPVDFHDTSLKISMSAPKEWHFVKSSITYDDSNKILLQILAPEIKAAPSFLIVSHFDNFKRVQDCYNLTWEILKNTFKNFTLRPDSMEYGEIDGLPSLTYITDYDSEDIKMVEYRIFILDTQELATFILRTDRKTFEEIKPDIDSIVKSFKWDKKYNRYGLFERYDNLPAGEFKHYKSNNYNFEMDIPVRWYCLPPDYSNSPYEVIRFGSHAEGPGPHKLIVFRFSRSPGQTLEQVRDNTQKTLAGLGYGNFVKAETTIGSKNVLMLDYNIPVGTWTVSSRQYFIPDGNIIYDLGFDTVDKDGMMDLYDRAAKTFRTE